jgi:hypothetical protein
MKTEKKHAPIAVPPLDQQTQNAHLSSFRARLLRIQEEPCMGELSPALLKMLDAGQIVCENESRGAATETVLAAKVTPADIRALLPLVTHPATYATFRFFLEGMINILAADQGDDSLQFCNTQQFLETPEAGLRGAIHRSGVEDPEWVGLAMMRAVSEVAVAEAIGFPVKPSADGWIYPHIGHQTIGVKPVMKFDEPLTYLSVEDFVDEIAVLTHPDLATGKAHLIGWIDRETFKNQHSVERRAGSFCCVLPQEKLFPLATLIELAKKTPLVPVQ